MRSSWFVAAVLVALAAAGWALHTLTAGEPERVPEAREADRSARARPVAASREEPEPRARLASPGSDEDTSTGGAGESMPTARDEAADRSTESGGDRPAGGGPPPRVEPTVDLAQARADFQAVLDELDEHAAAERHLANDEWVELYKRGNEALVPLQQHLDWKVPEEAQELRVAQTELREKLHAVAPRPVDAP